ncbi:CGI-121-domain-containing protein [Rhizopus microsporus var. microsporus]|uniref:EKC/KEOPS complex subunit CGI121 n=2 Tax=Rhizopus microsporus TaxID=58291 RepID=A0A2G4SF25_RHIZD|nr:CGI-121-domain-containing protein [Rhizopus microsporus ATCC 52813]ORE04396.1 CGI-121-domain-containing protein [Rhizopus microsporus var. microsporus]PHZ07380.1 CGI-121-domain-containing protein [Rhizopus microsporus ATCC 52813]
MESFTLELFPNAGQVHIALFKNVSNASELKQRLANQDATLMCALVDASYVLNLFHALLAINRAVHEQEQQKLKTSSVYSQIIFDFAPNTNIAKAFHQFGLQDHTTNVIAIKIGDSPEEAENFMKQCIKGDMVPLENLSSVRDLKAIKKAYQISDKEQDLQQITSLVAGAIALKGHS